MSKKNVEAVFGLSPMQQGMLFHTLHASGKDPGALHLQCSLQGPLDLDAFREAWARVVQRHPVLRTVLRWKELDQPLQIVLRSLEVPLEVNDLRDHSASEQARQLEAYLAADRERGLELAEHPTMRLALFQTGEVDWHLIWSCHHVLLDGWSGSLVLQEVVAITNARQLEAPVELAFAPPFRDYVRWLSRQPEAEAEAYWRGELAGIAAPTPLLLGEPREEGGQEGVARLETEVSAQTLAALKEAARRHQFTLSTVLHGAWSLLLSRISQEETVVFGSTTSGRAIDLPGVESMAGMLINTLPVRAEVRPDASALDVFRQLHAAQSGRDRFAYTDPAQVHAWSAVPAHRRLYESLLVVENYPVADTGKGPIRIGHVQGGITSTYPLTLIVIPGETLRIHLLYDAGRFSEETVAKRLDDLRRLLVHIADAPDSPARDLLGDIEPGVPLSGSTEASGRVHLDRSADYVAARSATEQALVEIWQDVLQVQPISVTDGFFEMGGNSISSTQIMARAQEAGLRIKTGDFFAHPTIQGLAEVLDGAVAMEQYLVPLEPSGTRPPLFIVHGWGGKLFEYLELARHLGEDQPVYGLQDVDRGEGEHGFPTLDALASRYAEDIRAAYPEGPYHVLGFSAGGTIAYAVAEHLRRAGGEIGTLFILDTFPPNLPRHVHARVIRPFLVRRARHHAVSLIQSPGKAVGTIKRLIRTAQKEFSGPPETDPQLDEETLGVQMAEPEEDLYVALRRQYVPPPCPMSVVLIESENAHKSFNLGLAWRHLVGSDVTMHRIEVEDHLEVLRKPHENGVAEIIQERLSRT